MNLNLGANIPVKTNKRAIFRFRLVSLVKRYHDMPVQIAN